MTTEGADQEVYLVPLGDETVLAIPIGGQDDTLGVEGPTLQTLIGAVGPLLGAALRGRGANAATYFELSPESLKKFEGARLDTVGSYFRGVLRNNEGQISHQVQLREVQASPAPPGIDPVALVQMAQMATLQAQLDRIEDTLADLSLSVELLRSSWKPNSAPGSNQRSGCCENSTIARGSAVPSHQPTGIASAASNWTLRLNS